MTEFKSKEAALLSELITMSKNEIHNPLFSSLTASLNSLVKAVEASVPMQTLFAKIFTHIKESWNEDRGS